MCGYGLLQLLEGTLPQVASASLEIIPEEGWEQPLTTIGLVFLLARAFSSGCAALTGVEAISNGVPAFRKPKSQNAATTLLMLGLIAVTMMLSVIMLARQMGLKYVDPHHTDRLRQAAVGHFFDVMTNGFGAMPSYAAQVSVRDRWAIVAYIRALQLSQYATLDDVPPDARSQLGQQ